MGEAVPAPLPDVSAIPGAVVQPLEELDETARRLFPDLPTGTVVVSVTRGQVTVRCPVVPDLRSDDWVPEVKEALEDALRRAGAA